LPTASLCDRPQNMSRPPINLFSPVPPPPGGERFDRLADFGNVEIERIVSAANAPPADYCQEHDEWVVLLVGEAEISVDGQSVLLQAGDHLMLPARTPHTVLRSSEGAVWLAVHQGRQSGHEEHK